MAHGIELEIVGAAIDSGNQVDKSGHIRNFFSKSDNFGKKPSVPTSKPPCTMEKTTRCGAIDDLGPRL